MGAAAIPLAIGSAALQAVGTISQAQAAKKQANYQAQVAMNNQIIANQNADAATQVGNAQENQKRQQVRQVIASQRAAQASSGIDINSGSALDVQSDTAALGELDALTIRDNASRQARGFRQQGLNYGAQAQLDRAAGQSALTGGYLSAAGQLMSSASSVGSKWRSWQGA